MKNSPIPRLDRHPELHNHLLKYCRLQKGEIWNDPNGKHRIGCLDAANPSHLQKLMAGEQAALAIHDPPYNLVAFEERELSQYITWCKKWIENTDTVLAANSSLYIWLGAHQTAGFHDHDAWHLVPLSHRLEFFNVRNIFPYLHFLSFIRVIISCRKPLAFRQIFLIFLI